jgi:hypothetical protein
MNPGEGDPVRFRFEATVIYWRGPSPFFFAPIPLHCATELRRAAKVVSYGWGVVPVTATVGGVAFTTSLFPKDDSYLLPLKAAVRRKANITAGDLVAVDMTIEAVREASR